jgi:two-component system response regulator ResD
MITQSDGILLIIFFNERLLNMKGKILIVEDETKLSDIMTLYLKKDNYEVTSASDAREAENYLNSESFDIIILDVMLPDKDGWALLRKIKASGSTPVILTTARGEEDDRIFGLELGADDYMVKPISMRELVLRVNLRINCKATKNRIIKFDNLAIIEDSREVIESNESVSLTPKEFDILSILIENPKRVFSIDQLFEMVWKTDSLEGDSRTIMVYISNIRKKIEPEGRNIKYIINVRGVGYKFNNSLTRS